MEGIRRINWESYWWTIQLNQATFYEQTMSWAIFNHRKFYILINFCFLLYFSMQIRPNPYIFNECLRTPINTFHKFKHEERVSIDNFVLLTTLYLAKLAKPIGEGQGSSVHLSHQNWPSTKILGPFSIVFSRKGMLSTGPFSLWTTVPN